jgi:phosphonate transport system permease protein
MGQSGQWFATRCENDHTYGAPGFWSLATVDQRCAGKCPNGAGRKLFGYGLAVPLGICGAGNLVPKPVYLVARTIIILSRTFHEIIVAILFVKIFGFGPLAGILTLTVGSTSFISKMIAEDIENMTPGQLEAIRATGANFPKLLIYCVSPQALPHYLGVSIYRLDANIRHSTVVGIVGAGGIGQVLYASFSRYDYDFSLAILLTIIALVFLGEFFSNWVRGYLR